MFVREMREEFRFEIASKRHENVRDTKLIHSTKSLPIVYPQSSNRIGSDFGSKILDPITFVAGMKVPEPWESGIRHDFPAVSISHELPPVRDRTTSNHHQHFFLFFPLVFHHEETNTILFFSCCSSQPQHPTHIV
jgi:hypothetical protein